MKTTLTAAFVAMVALLAAVLLRTVLAGEPEGTVADSAAADSSTTATAAVDPATADYERLGREYEKLLAAEEEVFPYPRDTNQPADTILSDELWLQQRLAKQASAPDPDTLLPQFVTFAENHSTSPLAFDAICFAVGHSVFQEFRGDGNPLPVIEQALRLAWANHKDDPRMAHLLMRLAVPSSQSESFFQRVLEDPPNRTVGAAATFQLARYYLTLAGCHKKSQRVENSPRLTNEDRFWKLVVTPNLQKYLPQSADDNSKKVEDLLGQVIADHSDVPNTNLRRSGPGWIFFKSVPSDPPETYGDLAAALLNRLTNLVPGEPVPEIVGTDADGNTFRLSDYRGQIVLLSFSADWCPGCVTFYPMARRLQEKYRDRPFVILGVNRNETVDTLKSAITEGKITWRCWWDGGTNGPIATAMSAGAGSLFVLDDGHIIQDAAVTIVSFEEDFDRAIEPLLEKAEARAETAQ